MALTTTQQAIKLFKKLMGVTDTVNPVSGIASDFFNENITSRSAVYPTQVWKDYSLIPSTAPSLSNSGVSGVVMYYQDLVLTAVQGSSTAFYDEQLKNTIPFNFDPAGSYNYTLKDNDGDTISFGQNNWVVDTDAGVLMFYGPSVPASVPPKISFYKYVGQFGVGSSTDYTLVLSGTTLTLSGGTSGSTVDLSYLPAMVQQISPTHRNLSALVTSTGTSGDGYLANTTTLSGNIVSGSSVRVFVNGVEVPCGNSSPDYCFFSPYSGVTGDLAPFSSARTPGEEQSNDYLNWRDNSSYQLDTDDKLDYIFLVNKN